MKQKIETVALLTWLAGASLGGGIVAFRDEKLHPSLKGVIGGGCLASAGLFLFCAVAEFKE